MAEARGMVQTADNSILQGRGVRSLTSQETKYYEKVIDAMKSKNPQQVLTPLSTKLFPQLLIDAINGRYNRGTSSCQKSTSRTPES